MAYVGEEAAITSRKVGLGPWAAALVAATLGCAGAPAADVGAGVFYASGAELQSINPLLTVHPLAVQVQRYVLFLTLAQYDSTLTPVPRLARGWSWSADRRTLTFDLRRDVMWHDSVPTTAADVVWTLSAARDPAVAYPRARDLAAVTSVEQADSFTVRLRFARPQPTFPDVLTDLAILPAHRFRGLSGAAIRTAPFNQHPVGNGPFAFVEHRPNQRWVFRRWDAFPADLGRPAIERFVIVIVDEASTKLAALTSGELDFAGIAPQHASFVRQDSRLEVLDYPGRTVYGLVFNLRRPVFQDLSVRRALSMAINRRLIVDGYLYGFGTVANGPVPPEHPWHADVPATPFDLAHARALLDSAGWRVGAGGTRERDGQRLAFSLLTVTTGENALEQMLQAQLKEIGAAVTIRPVELSTFLGLAQGDQRDFDALVTGLPTDLALSYLAGLIGGPDAGPLAYPGYNPPDVRQAMARVRAATTETETAAAWRDVQRIMARDVPVAWLYHARGVQGVNRRVQGIHIDLRGELAGISGWHVAREARRH